MRTVWILFLLLGLGVSFDARAQVYEVSETEVGRLYTRALSSLYDESFLDAAEGFEAVDREFPYSPWAAKAQLMAAFSYYMMDDYESAVVALDQFVNLNPSSADVPYALYLKGICYYEQIRDVERDQEKTLQALQAFEHVMVRYPESPYGIDARRKAAILFDNLAGKEMEVGRFYLEQGEYLAALNRFNVVLRDYSQTLHIPEALHRLVEGYLRLGLVSEAFRSAAVLGHNFPDNQWYQDSYALLMTQGGRNFSATDDDNKRASLKEGLARYKDADKSLKDGNTGLMNVWRRLLEGSGS